METRKSMGRPRYRTRKRPSSEIRRAAHDEGMASLRESALERVRLGLTTLKEINKVTFVE